MIGDCRIPDRLFRDNHSQVLSEFVGAYRFRIVSRVKGRLIGYRSQRLLFLAAINAQMWDLRIHGYQSPESICRKYRFLIYCMRVDHEPLRLFCGPEVSLPPGSPLGTGANRPALHVDCAESDDSG